MKVKLLIFLAYIFLITAYGLSAQEGIVTYMEGDIQIQRDSDSFPADFGSDLFQGDKITTGTDSLVIIQLTSKGVLKLKENTVLVLEKVSRDTSLILDQGSVFSRVNKLVTGSFSVKTRSMVAGVRGTEFFIAFGKTIETEPDVWLCVNEGLVQVALVKTGESVLVKEGEGINILSGKTLTNPEFYPWTKKLNWNTDPDKGTVEDTTDLNSAYTDLLDQDYE